MLLNGISCSSFRHGAGGSCLGSNRQGMQKRNLATLSLLIGCRTKACRIRSERLKERIKQQPEQADRKTAERIYAIAQMVLDTRGELPDALLHEAIGSCDPEFLHLLVKNGVNVSKRVDGVLPIYRALDEGAIEVMWLLFQYGALACPETEAEYRIIESAKRSHSESKQEMLKCLEMVSLRVSDITTIKE